MKKRVLSAIVALAIFIPVFFVGGMWFKIAVYIVAMLGLKEFLDVREERKPFPDLIKLIAYLWLTIIFYEINYTKTMTLVLDYRYITSMFLVLMLPIVLYHDSKKYNINDACYVISGVLLLPIVLSLAVAYRNISLRLIVFLFLITILTDTFAYIIGRLIGKNKLLEVISPNKTWEGFVGGSLVGTFVCTTFYITVIDQSAQI